jgi:hypothetical protein
MRGDACLVLFGWCGGGVSWCASTLRAVRDTWEPVTVAAVGGLTDVGFSSDGAFLLVLGHHGRGLFDCHSGERVARDGQDDWAFLDDGGYAEGIGPLRVDAWVWPG